MHTKDLTARIIKCVVVNVTWNERLQCTCTTTWCKGHMQVTLLDTTAGHSEGTSKCVCEQSDTYMHSMRTTTNQWMKGASLQHTCCMQAQTQKERLPISCFISCAH